MANSYVEYSESGTGTNQLGQQVFSFSTVDYLNITDINVKGWNGSVWQSLALLDDYGINGYNSADKTLKLNGTPSYNKIRLYRSTTSNALVDFVDGARLTETDLDTAYKQGLFVAQEVSEDAAAIGTLTTSNLNLTGDTTVANLTATGTVVIPSGTGATHFYREGTWTPVALDYSGTITFSNAVYTKVGNTVHYTLHVTNRSNTSDTSQMAISGLPYQALGEHPAAVGVNSATFGHAMVNTAETLYFYNTTGGSFTYNDFPHTTGYARIQGAYRTA
tara:strand:+ start:641 stop:1468 length:828 start_codon:yes stop_codon:yes gene_type:complete